MSDRRLIDNYCSICDDIQKAAIQPADPGSCVCIVCGNVAQLMVPIS